METNSEHLPHDLRPYDQALVDRVEKLFTDSDVIAHELFRKIIEVDHES